MPHPAKLLVLCPMYKADDYRSYPSAVDDAVVVHHPADGEFLLSLRPMAKLGPRSYARYVINLSADLEAGYTVVVQDIERFLPQLETLARKHVAIKDRNTLERAVQIITERTREQLRNHVENYDDFGTRAARRIIADRPRRTRADRGESDSYNCMCGIPVPRSEQLWNTFCSEWETVRGSQHAHSAWLRWVRNGRQDMPTADHPVS